MKDNGCYLCKSDTKYLFEKNNRKYAKCLSCGLVYIASLKDPEKTELENHYSQKESTHQEKLNKKEYKKLIKRMEYRLGIIENYCHSKGKLLDIGCGQGSFLDVAKNNGWECSGVEISKNDCKYVREKLNIKVHNTELSGVNFPDDYFDAITLWHVFEHFIDPLTELKEIHRILSPGGIVCLEIPNIDSLAFRILGKKWKYINDEHIFYFNKKTIGRFIKTSGFKLMYITGISGFPWWGKYRGFKRVNPWIYNRYGCRRPFSFSIEKNMKSKVVIVKCENYDSKNVDLAVRHAFELLGGIEKYVKSSDRILLKPNLLGAFAPEKGVTTHPEIVRALIRIVKEKNATPYVGDSHGGGLSENIDNVLKKTGISKLCDEEKCEIVNFESAGVKRIKATNQNNRKVPVLELTKAVFDFNSVFSIAKMKTHSLMVITGAIKNLYGCVPGLSKTYYHLLATHPQDFAEMLADILSIVKPRLGIIDGITTMEGEGPTYGKLKHLGIIMVSDDLVALDTVMAKIMGLNPKKDPVIRATVRCGLGIGDIENIEILGEKIEDVIPEKFELPPNSKIRLIPRWLGPLVKKFLWTKPKILQENCTLCQKCLKSCPAQIITVIDKKITIDKSKCIGCMCCYELCPSGAVAIEYSILAKIFFSRGKIIASIRNIIEYSLCLVLEGIVLLLPRRTALLLGALLSNTARVCLASREKLVRKNLSLTFPDKNDSEINTIAGNVWKNFGFGLAEFIKIKQTDKKNYIKYAEFDESEINFREAFKDKKGVILLTAHFGNWEMMGASLLFRGYKIMTIARNLRNPYGNRAIAKMREIGGGRTVEEHQAVRESLRWLRAGNCLAIIIDQHITEGGVIVDFLGRPAYTTPIITLLAKKTGAKIVPVYNLRTQPGKIRIFAEKVVELISTSDNKQDLMVNTENFNKIIGKWILKNPEQWFWLHNRWKVK